MLRANMAELDEISIRSGGTTVKKRVAEVTENYEEEKKMRMKLEEEVMRLHQ